MISKYVSIIPIIVLLIGCSFKDQPKPVLVTASDHSTGVEVQVRRSVGTYTTKLPAIISVPSFKEQVVVTVTDPCYEPDSFIIEDEGRSRTTIFVTPKECIKKSKNTLTQELATADKLWTKTTPGNLIRPDPTIQLSDDNQTATPTEPSLIDIALYQLGGAEVSYLQGHATVHSYIERGDGSREEIANGSKEYKGYEIKANRPSINKGFYHGFSPRYLFQSITIADFRKEIPLSETPGGEDIPVVVTDFDTGYPVDPEDPNRYEIRLSSWGIIWEGQVKGVSSCKLFSLSSICYSETLIGINLLENMTMEVELGKDSAKESKWINLSAFTIGFLGGVHVSDISSYFELGFHYLEYPSLKLPKKVEFRDKVRYNSDKQVFERERVFLDEVSLDILTLKLSYTYEF